MTEQAAKETTEELAPQTTEDATQAEELAPQVEENAAAATESAPEEETLSSKAQERINKVTADKYVEKNRADGLQAQLDKIEQEKAAPPELGARPTLEDPDVDYDQDKLAIKQEKYFQRKAQIETHNAATQRTQQATQDKQQQQSLRDQTSFTQKAEDVKKEHADYDDVSAVAVNAIRDPQVRLAILKAENGPSVLYHLGKNLDKADALNGLDSISGVLEIANINNQLKSSTKTTTKAPDTIPDGLSGGGGGATDDFDSKYPNATFV